MRNISDDENPFPALSSLAEKADVLDFYRLLYKIISSLII